MENRVNKKKLGWSIGAAPATAALAASSQTSAQAYNATLAYEGGTVVSFEGRTYRAKWYANAGQSPADVHTVTHPWETP